MQVKKRNGQIENFDPQKINKAVQRLGKGLKVSSSEIILNARIPEKAKRTIPTSEIKELIELAAAAEAWKEIDYSYFAALQRLDIMYERIFNTKLSDDSFIHDYRSAFVRGIKVAIKQDLFDAAVVAKFDLDKLARALKPDRDRQYLWHSLVKLEAEYLGRDRNRKIFELPQSFHMRVAMGVSCNEADPTAAAIEAYELYSTFRAAGSSPTLFNTLSKFPQLSSCYLQEIHDSTSGIFDGMHQAALKCKHAGGLGFHMSKLRACGSAVKSTNGSSTGVIPFARIYNNLLIAMNQSGKRPGAGCIYMEPWHLDIEEFMDLRRKDGDELRRAHQINTAIWYPELFFKRLKSRENWTLFCPSEVGDLTDLHSEEFETRYIHYEALAAAGKIKHFKTMPARDLWQHHIESLFETSHPWVTFKDNANVRFPNRHTGFIHGSNLCTEIFLATKPSSYGQYGKKTSVGETAVCNLSSINLAAHTSYKDIQWDLLADTVKKVIRRLDNVIDINFYPTEEAHNANMLHRPVGLGVMGWFDMYTKLGVPQDSPEAIDLTSKVMEFISYHAIDTSADLAQERGSYESFQGSDWSKGVLPKDTYAALMAQKSDSEVITSPEYMDWETLRAKVMKGMRNSCLMAIAPNASISYLLGCSASVEAPFAVISAYDTGNGEYFIATPVITEVLAKHCDLSMIREIVDIHKGSVQAMDGIPEKTKRLLRTAFEVDQNTFIMVNAARQKWIDQGISFNMYFTTKNPKVISDAYKLANNAGLKSTYYYYGKSATQTRSIGGKAPEKTEVAQAEQPIWVKKGHSSEEEYIAAKTICSLNNPSSCQSCEG